MGANLQHNLFVYGTLQLPEKTSDIIGRMPVTIGARLYGYRCGVVARANFPGIVPHTDSSVPGLLLSGLNRDELRQLDIYEGELYRRIQVQVEVDDKAGFHQCWVYAIAQWALTRVTEEPWTIEWYRQLGNKGRLTYRT